MTPLQLKFREDGLTPNSILPVLIYQAIENTSNMSMADYLEHLFQSNNWTNNWRSTVLTQNHYHSTTHEVLGIAAGEVDLVIGGHLGQKILAKVGDVLILPAGTGHFSMSNENPYEVIGGYPNGLEWDLIYDETDKYEAARKRIAALELPDTDPVLGTDGPLKKLWLKK